MRKEILKFLNKSNLTISNCAYKSKGSQSTTNFDFLFNQNVYSFNLDNDKLLLEAKEKDFSFKDNNLFFLDQHSNSWDISAKNYENPAFN